MTFLPTLLAKIPDESKPVGALAIGAFVLVFLVLLHGAGIHVILLLHPRRLRRLRKGRPRLLTAVFLFGWAVFLMLALHVGGFGLWAYALLLLGIVPRAYNAIYFSANAYTTLGFGNVDLTDHWRIIDPIIGISGLFTFAWTTSALANVVTAHSELMELEDERAREFEMRSDLRKEIWKTLKSERSAERLERFAMMTKENGTSLLVRFRVWKEMRKKMKQLREARTAEIIELRRKARGEDLGPGDEPDKTGEGA